MNRDVSTKVAADTSSLILLQKVGLLACFLQNYEPVIAEAVFGELDVRGKKGAAELARCLRHAVPAAGGGDGIAGLGRGESGAILLWKKGMADFLLLDDKKAALYCKARAIPFVNCLLVPRILEQAGVLSRQRSASVLSLLIRHGYYSKAVIRRAAAMHPGDLLHFHPRWAGVSSFWYS